MKKYSKKIALILVLVLSLTAAIPALATTTKIDGAYEVEEISVIVPQIGSAVLNPFSLPVKVYADNTTTVVGTLDKPGQIATRPLVGVNMSGVDLKVGATVIGTVKDGSNFKFATSAPSATSTANSGLVYLQVKKSSQDLGYGVSSDTSATVSGGFDAVKVMDELDNWAQPSATVKYDPKAADVLTVGKKAASKTFNTTIKAGTVSTGVVGDPVDTADADGYFVARLVGNIAKKPKKAWTELDGFEVSIAWEFEPA